MDADQHQHDGPHRDDDRPPAAAYALPFADESSRGSRSLTVVIVVAVAALVLAFIGYEVLLAPPTDRVWTPPPGVAREDTPAWLQSLCADHTPELCAAADRARQPQECDSMRAALDEVRSLERELAARGRMTAQQHFVLVELYGQGRELCEYQVAQ